MCVCGVWCVAFCLGVMYESRVLGMVMRACPFPSGCGVRRGAESVAKSTTSTANPVSEACRHQYLRHA